VSVCLREVRIVRLNVSDGNSERRLDVVSEEFPLHVFLNDSCVVSILCSPSKLKELAVGYLVSEGFVHGLDEVSDVRLEEDGRCFVRLKLSINAKERLEFASSFGRLVVSGCGSADLWPLSKLVDRIKGLKVKSDAVVDAKVVVDCVRRLNSLAEEYKRTGGVHAASLNRLDGGLVGFAEDVGRHNAVDKVIGAGVLRGVDFGECFLALSGRLSADVVLKAARVGLPLVASRAAALSSAVEIAERCGVGLAGFVRGVAMNVYAHAERFRL
jgi:FdhD protein